MVERIRIYGEDVLREEAVKVEKIDDYILETLDNMVETMIDAGGVGLAAPQIGIGLTMFVLGVEGVIRKVINPEILYLSEELAEREEGCLSIPGVYKKLERPNIVKVRYQNEKGEVVEEEAEGLLSRAFQHEYDHLVGELFVDKLGPVGKKLINNKLKKLKKLSAKESN